MNIAVWLGVSVKHLSEIYGNNSSLKTTYGSGRILIFTIRSTSSLSSFVGTRTDTSSPFPPSYVSEIDIASMNALPDDGTCASDVEEDIWREKV